MVSAALAQNAAQEAAPPEDLKIDFKDEPEVIAAEIKRVIRPGMDVHTVARKIVDAIWDGEQAHPLKHTSQSYYFEGAFHGEGHIPIVVGTAKLMSRGWKEFEIMAIFIFDEQKVLQDVFVRKRQISL